MPNEPVNTLPIDASNQPTALFFSNLRTFLQEEEADRLTEFAVIPNGLVISGGTHATAAGAAKREAVFVGSVDV